MASFIENCISSYIKLCKHYSDMTSYDAEYASALGKVSPAITSNVDRRHIRNHMLLKTSMVPAAMSSELTKCNSLAEFIGEDESFPFGPSWARMDILDSNATDENIKWFAETIPAGDMWEMLKNCRVFCIDPEIYSKVYSKSMNITFSEFYELDCVSDFSFGTNDSGEISLFVASDMRKDKFGESLRNLNLERDFQKMARDIPPMSELPFESMYLAYGDGIPLDPFQEIIHDELFTGSGEFSGSNKKLKGHVILPGGWVYEHIACDFTHIINSDDFVNKDWNWYLNIKKEAITKEFGITDNEVLTELAQMGLKHQIGSLKRYATDREITFNLLVRHGTGTPFIPCWTGAYTLVPWTLTAISEIIAENSKSIILQSGRSHTGLADTKGKRRAVGLPGKKRKNKHSQKNLPPFYVIDLKPSVVDQTSVSLSLRSNNSGGIGTGTKLQYRHDRAGHDRLLVRRDSLPLDFFVEEDLLNRGYDIWVDAQPDMYTRSQLVKRRLPMRRDGEWLAIRTVHVNSTVVGDEDLDYKPAARRLSYESVKDLI